jgi:hypothetical protein
MTFTSKIASYIEIVVTIIGLCIYGIKDLFPKGKPSEESESMLMNDNK